MIEGGSKMSNTERFHELLDGLIALNKENRPDDKDLPPEIHAGFYCVVRVNIGRGSGNTSYINLRSTDNDLIVSKFTLMKFKNKCSLHLSEANVIYGAVDGVILCEDATIYVDDTIGLKPEVLHSLIDHFANYKRTFVFLG
jgi:hypothetical protein